MLCKYRVHGEYTDFAGWSGDNGVGLVYGKLWMPRNRRISCW